MRIIVVGGGFGGCAAALAAAKEGAEVILLERTDLLLGTGLAGGIIRNHYRKDGLELCAQMGAGELLECCDRTAVIRDKSFPGHPNATFFHPASCEKEVRSLLERAGVRILWQTRADGAKKEQTPGGIRLTAILTKEETFSADGWIDATGTAGPPTLCSKYGNGCVCCVLRCPAFGGRVSLCSLAGIKERPCLRDDGTAGAFSGSLKIAASSISPELRERLEEEGVLWMPRQKEGQVREKVCAQYALPEYARGLVLLWNGDGKLMTSHLPLEELRSYPGLEECIYADPGAGGKGNSVRLLAIPPLEDDLRVCGTENLWCAGEKVGGLIGHTEAVLTGTLAGRNAVKTLRGENSADPDPEHIALRAVRYAARRSRSSRPMMGSYTLATPNLPRLLESAEG
ncbi:MAG: FAD-dependent oxidoreductase [Oscillospiraceae bacterium]|nr:FAD-dependent oxidoreductase [Oscillospiraceae bacterium]